MGECAVLYEARILRQAGGAKRLMDEYRAQLAARQAQRDAQERGESSGDVPHRLQKLGVPYDAIRGAKESKPTQAMQAAKEFNADKEARFLLLLGPKGIGKTSAAASVLWEFCARYPWNDLAQGSNQEPAMFCQAFQVTRMSVFEAKDRNYVERLTKAKLLVLDDVGDECTELGRSTVVDLLLAREAARRRTVLTGNLTVPAFKARYGEALADRIRASGIIPMLEGKSLRGTKA